MKYRDIAGSYNDSDVVELLNVDELKAHVNARYADKGMAVEDLMFNHMGFDKEIGWDVYNVICKFQGDPSFMVIGMSDGSFFEEPVYDAVDSPDDYQKLKFAVIKYMDLIAEYEGDDYVDRCNHEPSEIVFSTEEIKLLQQLSKAGISESKKKKERKRS